jgi:HPt (histidine-containing phosphotransfer) domain-containing protein
MTRSSRAAGAVLALILAGAATLPAQETEAAWPEGTPVAAAQGAGCEGGPLAVVAQFLGLAPEQVQALGRLLQEREQSLAAVQQQIAARERQILQLIMTGGDPAQIGPLVVEVHELRQSAQTVQAQFLASFPSLLSEPQRQRWAQVQMAAQLLPVVPAFQALRLL